MRQKTIGYIVQSSAYGPMLLSWDHESQQDQLYFGNYATLFSSRRQAQSAIKRKLADRQDWQLSFGKLSIVRISATAQPAGDAGEGE